MTASGRKLTLDDIVEARAYERERQEFRAHVIEIKRRRRVNVGPIVTLLFENRDTIRFQIQEMARAERIGTDAGIQVELDAYNPLVPEPGQLCATMFIELTEEAEMREWLPCLVGVEREVELRLPGGHRVRCAPDPAHEAQLTREHVTAAVHYVTFALDPSEVDAFREGVELAITHPEYTHAVVLSPEAVAELRTDLEP